MTVSSHLGYVAKYDLDDALKNECPLSTNNVRYMANNGKHLLDEYMQPRINIVTTNGDDIGIGFPGITTMGEDSLGNYTHAFSHIIPWSVKPQGYPASIICRVTAEAAADKTFTVAAILSPNLTPVSYEIDKTTGNYLYYEEGVEDTEAVNEIIYSYTDLNSDGPLAMMAGAFWPCSVTDRDIDNDQISRAVDIYLLRFTCWVAGWGRIVTVSVREYNG